MAADTYSLQALVLRKTKLGETDLIVTLLAQDGRQVRAVAKGARKPNSSFASRLEIFSEVEARYSRLTREFPERAGELFERNEQAAMDRYQHLLKLKAMYDAE